jgi:hypothetical protein
MDRVERTLLSAAFDFDFDLAVSIPTASHSDQSRPLSEAEGDGGAEEPSVRPCKLLSRNRY